MKRTLKLSQKVGDILLGNAPERGLGWTGAPDDALRFDFVEQGVQGVVSLSPDMAREVEYEIAHDEHGREVEFPVGSRRIAVTIEGECEGAMDDEEFLDIAQRLAGTYVNRMVSYLRVQLSHHWLRPVPMSAWTRDRFLHETGARWVEGDRETAVSLGRALVLFVGGDVPFDERTPVLCTSIRDELWSFVEGGRDPAPDRELIASAKEHFVTGEHRVAAVEAVSALEIGLAEFARTRCNGAGGRFGVSKLLKQVLPQQLTDEELQFCEGLMKLSDQLCGVRNLVVHEGWEPRTEDIDGIKQGISAVEQLLLFVDDLNG